MLFNSYEFIFLFLPIVFFGYFILLKKRLVVGAKLWLAVSSLAFYGYWNINYVTLFMLSIVVNYVFGIALASSQQPAASSQQPAASSQQPAASSQQPAKLLRYFASLPSKFRSKSLLIFGIAFNLGLLGFFKYTDFFLENFNGIFGTDIPLPHILLPIGISFFTFTQIAFLVDAYKGEAKEYSFIHYVLFVSYFPHLLAGPILHHKEMMPQFASRWNWAVRWRHIALGLFIFSIGLFKKVAIADTFAVWADTGFSNSASLHLIDAWVTSLSYTFQLYFDFSGYTDMAIGISLLFNIKLPINFNSPYKALDIQDFWRRWHMTLSRFLRNYLYIPLGGNRKSKYRTYANLIITFLLGGLWHGAGWTFVVWGLMHGIALAIHRLWQSLGFKMHKVLAWIITFNFVNLAWVFFRAESFTQAKQVIKAMFFGKIALSEEVANFINYVNPISLIVKLPVNQSNSLFAFSSIEFILLGFVVVLFCKNSNDIAREGRSGLNIRNVFVVMLMIVVVFFNSINTAPSEFLYFNF